MIISVATEQSRAYLLSVELCPCTSVGYRHRW